MHSTVSPLYRYLIFVGLTNGIRALYNSNNQLKTEKDECKVFSSSKKKSFKNYRTR